MIYSQLLYHDFVSSQFYYYRITSLIVCGLIFEFHLVTRLFSHTVSVDFLKSLLKYLQRSCHSIMTAVRASTSAMLTLVLLSQDGFMAGVTSMLGCRLLGSNLRCHFALFLWRLLWPILHNKWLVCWSLGFCVWPCHVWDYSDRLSERCFNFHFMLLLSQVECLT